MFENILSYHQLLQCISVEPAVLVFFANEKCGVCKSLKPKIEKLSEQHFPDLKLLYVNAELNPDITGNYRIFTMPSVLVFFQEKETIRKIRIFSVQELKHEINRYYTILFNN